MFPFRCKATSNGSVSIVGCYQRTSEAPQARPPPMPSSSSKSPFLMRPSLTAVSSARGIEAADVLACLSTVTTTRSGGRPSLRPVPSMMRLLAWCGTSQSMSLDCRPAFRSEEHTSELQSHSDLVCRLLLEKKKKIAKHEHYNTKRRIKVPLH